MYRETEAYRTMTPYEAVAIAEGFSGEDEDEDTILAAWQYIWDTGLWQQLQGFYGRTVHQLVENGHIQL